MAKIPEDLRKVIGDNIRSCRQKAFPGRGGGKQCAAALGVSPQQWSPWEKGTRTPDETSLRAIAKLFGVDVEYMRHDNTASTEKEKANALPAIALRAPRLRPQANENEVAPAMPHPGFPLGNDNAIPNLTGPELYSYMYREKVKVKFKVTVTYEVTDMEFAAV